MSKYLQRQKASCSNTQAPSCTVVFLGRSGVNPLSVKGEQMRDLLNSGIFLLMASTFQCRPYTRGQETPSQHLSCFPFQETLEGSTDLQPGVFPQC